MSNTQFIDNIDQFIQVVMVALENIGVEILISGVFDNETYKKIFDNIINNSNIKDCKIIIPYVTSSGIISRMYINKLFKNGSKVRINSQFRKNLIVIGKHAFVLFFSPKYNKQDGVKFQFEYCMQTEEQEVVEKIRESFVDKWQYSIPLVN